MTDPNKGCTQKGYLIYQVFVLTFIIIGGVLGCFILKNQILILESNNVSSSPSGQAPVVTPPAAGAIYIPTVKELQEALCEAGYEVEVDCVVGRETKAAWDSFCADRFAAEYMTKSGGLEAVK